MLSYKFYPSILDKFQSYLDTRAEDFFYQDDAGAWHKNYDEESGMLHYSEEEVDAFLLQELFDAINRAPHEPSEVASKGTALNEVVDCILHHRKSENEDVVICTADFNGIKTIKATCDGFDFYFDKEFCKSVANYFAGALSQVFTSATIETKYGEVELYGYVDELRENKVFDLKTTKRYEFGKYSKYWQRHVYPYTLIESGLCTEVNEFEFTAYVLKGGTSRVPLISGTQYREVYQYDHEQSKALLKDVCERFIEFLEEHREQITNTKIFALS